MENVLEDIREMRKNALSEEQKDQIVTCIKNKLIYSENVIIYGAAHFANEPFMCDIRRGMSAPYKLHPAISTYLTSLGFYVSRYYNRGGIDQGICVTLRN